jgi:hypothetical protein
MNCQANANTVPSMNINILPNISEMYKTCPEMYK